MAESEATPSAAASAKPSGARAAPPSRDVEAVLVVSAKAYDRGPLTGTLVRAGFKIVARYSVSTAVTWLERDSSSPVAIVGADLDAADLRALAAGAARGTPFVVISSRDEAACAPAGDRAPAPVGASPSRMRRVRLVRPVTPIGLCDAVEALSRRRA